MVVVFKELGLLLWPVEQQMLALHFTPFPLHSPRFIQALFPLQVKHAHTHKLEMGGGHRYNSHTLARHKMFGRGRTSYHLQISPRLLPSRKAKNGKNWPIKQLTFVYFLYFLFPFVMLNMYKLGSQTKVNIV